jgi:hypothetical protein
MASVIRIKRSGTTGAPSGLASGELAYSALSGTQSNGGERLYIGFGTPETNGIAPNMYVIGGKYFTDMLDHVTGTLTASSAVLVDADRKVDNFKVDNLDLDGNTLSVTNTNGNLFLSPNGTGKVIIANPFIGDADTSLTEFIQDVTGGQLVSSTGSIDIAYNDTAGTTNVGLNVEFAQDLVGDMVTGSTQSGISVTYDDNNGKLNFDVNDPTLAVSGDISGSAVMTNLGNTTITTTLATVNSNVGSFGSTTKIPTFTVNGKGLVTAAGEVDVATTLSIGAESGSASVSLLNQTLTIAAGEGIDTVASGTTVTISAEDATTTNKGVASFNTDNFTVSSGAVSTKNITLGTSTLTNGSTTTTLAGLQQLDVDNIRVDGNEISSTDTNGNISLNPNGTGNVAVNDSRITGVADPVDPQDAATKAYVDARAAGLDPKQSVRAATTGPITLSGVQTIDGVALSVGNRVLVKDQTNNTLNGIYVVASGAWSRSSDMDEPSELTAGLFFFVEEGLDYADSGWVKTSDSVGTVGTDPITFVQFSGAGQIVAGDGLSKTGNTLSVNVANGIEISGDNVQLASSVAGGGLTYSSGVLNVVGTADRITVNSDSIDIASTYIGQSSITTLGTIGTGVWQGTVISPTYGGTGVNNGTKTITLGGNFTHTGAHTLGLTTTANTSVTLPTTGTLATLAGTETLTNKTIQGAVITGGSINNTPIGATTASTGAFTTIAASGNVTVQANITGAGAATSNLSGFNIDGGTY